MLPIKKDMKSTVNYLTYRISLKFYLSKLGERLLACFRLSKVS